MTSITNQMSKGPMGRWTLAIGLAAAITTGGCANTAGGVGGTVDAGQTATDTGPGTTDTGSGQDATPGVDVPVVAGASLTVAEVQAKSTPSAKCDSAIENTIKSVNVSGVVVVSPLRKSKTGSGKELEGLFVQQKGGGVSSGLYLSEDAGGPLSSLALGDVVDVVGEVAEFYCYTQLKPKAAVGTGATELPMPTTVDVASIGETATTENNRKYESVLIMLENVVVAEPLGLGSDSKPHNILVGKTEADKTLRIGSGFGTFMQTKEGAANYTKGQKLNIKGFLEYSFKVWQVTPLSVTVVP